MTPISIFLCNTEYFVCLLSLSAFKKWMFGKTLSLTLHSIGSISIEPVLNRKCHLLPSLFDWNKTFFTQCTFYLVNLKSTKQMLPSFSIETLCRPIMENWSDFSCSDIKIKFILEHNLSVLSWRRSGMTMTCGVNSYGCCYFKSILKKFNADFRFIPFLYLSLHNNPKFAFSFSFLPLDIFKIWRKKENCCTYGVYSVPNDSI